MLMDFQMEGGQAITAEINAEMQDLSKRYRAPSHERRTFELPAYARNLMVPILLAVFACAFAIIRAEI